MRRLEMFLRYMIFISATILVVSHMVRGFNWYPLVFIWLTTLPLVLLKGEK